MVSSKDVPPTFPVTSQHPLPSQPHPPTVGMYPINLAVQNAQQFITETFRGAQLLESHNVCIVSEFLCQTKALAKRTRKSTQVLDFRST